MKKKALTAAACLIIAVVLLSAFCGRKPYKDLQPSDIVSAAVSFDMPDKTIQITEIKELTEYLSKVVIYKEDNSYTEYAGQGVTFTLTMADATEEKNYRMQSVCNNKREGIQGKTRAMRKAEQLRQQAV